MNPWFFFRAPQVTLPFGGSVARRIVHALAADPG
jgi:hypothetical protein